MSKANISGTENVLVERIPLDVMKGIWNDGNESFSDEQLIKMREFAYLLMENVIKIARSKKRNNLIELNSTIDENKESHFIHPGEYRRAS